MPENIQMKEAQMDITTFLIILTGNMVCWLAGRYAGRKMK
jgi:hypothetical protein